MLNKSQEEQSILPKFCIWDLNCSHMQLMYQQLVVAWLFQVMEKQGLADFLLILLLYIITKYIGWNRTLIWRSERSQYLWIAL